MEQNKVILGVETHLDTHVGAVISETGKLLKTLSVSAETQGYLNLLIWPNSFDHRWR
jgi:transposase